MKFTLAVAALAGVAAAAPQLATREVAAVAAVQNQQAAQAADQKAGLATSPEGDAPKSAPHNTLTGIGIGIGVTKQDVKSGVCRPVTYIFARGTTEAGNIGSRGFAGVGLMNNLVAKYGASGIALQGVNYDAANFFSNFELGDRGGVNDMEYEIEKAVSQCKTTKLVLGGYS
jgi:Cutinase